MIGAGLDMVCWGISISLLASLNARDSFPLHLQLHVCPSDLPLHLGGEDLPQYVLLSSGSSEARIHTDRG